MFLVNTHVVHKHNFAKWSAIDLVLYLVRDDDKAHSQRKIICLLIMDVEVPLTQFFRMAQE